MAAPALGGEGTRWRRPVRGEEARDGGAQWRVRTPAGGRWPRECLSRKAGWGGWVVFYLGKAAFCLGASRGGWKMAKSTKTLCSHSMGTAPSLTVRPGRTNELLVGMVCGVGGASRWMQLC